MNIISDEELRATRRRAFVIGGTVASAWNVFFLLACLLAYWRLYYQPPAAAGVPQILLQAPSQTIARIPTLRDGKRIDCTVTIDQAKNVWSITC
jgi:hypothetical protein